MNTNETLELILDKAWGDLLSGPERTWLLDNIPELLPKPFGVTNHQERRVIALENPLTGALFYDRVWSPVPMPRASDAFFFGGTRYETINGYFVVLKNFAIQALAGDSRQRDMVLRLTFLHELFLSLDNFHEVDFSSKSIDLKRPAARSVAASLSSELGIDASTLHVSDDGFRKDYQEGTNEVLVTTLINIGVIDESTLDFEQVQEFRRDASAREKLRRVRHWLQKEMIGKSASYVQDELTSRIDDYSWALRKHGIKSTLGALTTVMESKSALAAIGSAGALAWLDHVGLGVASGLSLLGARCAVEMARLRFEREEVRRSHPEVAFIVDLKSRFGVGSE